MHPAEPDTCDPPERPTYSSLRIRRPILERIFAWASSASPNEMLGLLGRPANIEGDVITAARMLPARAWCSGAVAEPLDLIRLVEHMRSQGLVVAGLFHSHGRFGVFSSSTDDESVRRFLPALSGPLFRRPRPAVLAPTVPTADRALLPFADGRGLVFTLQGPHLGDGLFEAAAWCGVRVRLLGRSVHTSAILQARHLVLRGECVSIRLEIPPGATVLGRWIDLAPVRWATLYSLVVNDARQTYAEQVVMHDIDGETFLRQRPCPVVVDTHLHRSASLVAASDEATTGQREDGT